MKSEHPDVDWEDTQAPELVGAQAYSATDS
jgi:hypothetical protein